MSKRVLKLIGLSLTCAAILAVAALAQNGAAAIEGNYNVTASSNELGTINFLLILKRDGGKWAAEIKDSPTPLTVTTVTVDDTNKITIVADAGGTPVTIVGKFDNGAIAGDWSAGDVKGTWKAAKKDAVVAAAKSAVGTGWINSYSAFVREVANWSGDKPGATVIGMNEGQFVSPERWEIMKTFGNQKVTWEAAFQGLKRGSPLLSDKGGESKEMDKVDMKLEAAGFATMNHVFTKQTEIERWKAVSVGSRVSFRARVVGIGYFGPVADKIIYIFTLQDAELADAKSAEKPAAAPATDAAPTASAAAGLEGTYDAKVIADGQGELAFTLIIKRDGDKLVTAVENGGDLNVVSIEVKDPDVVNLSATYQGNGPIPLPGKRAGAEMGGKWEFGGFSGTWSAKKKN